MMMTDPWKWARSLHSRSHTKIHEMLFRYFFFFFFKRDVSYVNLSDFLRTPTSPPHLLFLSEQRVKSVARWDKWEFFSFLVVYFSFLCTLLQQCVAFGVFMLNGRASFFFFPPHNLFENCKRQIWSSVYFFVITEFIHTESVFILATIQPQNCPVFMFRVEN